MKTRVIKRYKNRKYYDTGSCKYVKLPELAKLLYLGVDLKVIDMTTRNDITELTMVRMRYEVEMRRLTTQRGAHAV